MKRLIYRDIDAPGGDQGGNVISDAQKLASGVNEDIDVSNREEIYSKSDDPDKEGNNDNDVVSQNNLDPVWSKIVEAEGEEFSLPEDISAENQYEHLESYYKNKFSNKDETENKIDIESLPDHVQELYVASQDEDFDINKFYESKVESLRGIQGTDDEVIRTNLVNKRGLYDEKENPNGLTEDDISDYLSNMNKIQKMEMADQIREAENEKLKSEQSDYANKIAEKQKARIKSIQEQQTELWDKVFQKTRAINEINGMEVTEEEHQRMEPIFKEMVSLKDDGTVPLLSALQNMSNESLYKLIYLIDKGEDAVKAYFSSYKENVKQKVLDKTDTQFKSNKRQGGTPGFSDEEIARRLSQPDPQ